MVAPNQNVMSGTRAALVVAHPGHELVVHRWLEVARPLVFVLTDGSGRSQQSRINSTTRILEACGARPATIYGRLSDSDAYAAILDRDFDLFIGLAREMGQAFVDEKINFVAGDALEGYNPMHDVCRLITNAAAAVAARTNSRELANFEFSLVNPIEPVPQESQADEIWLHLEGDALARKMAAAQGYAELAGEVDNALGRAPLEGFRLERLRPVDAEASARRFEQELPFYEHHGAKRVSAGHYQRVLRYREHIVPLADALGEWAVSGEQ